MATGWAKEGAVQEQIDSTVAEGIELARSRLSQAGEGLTHCEECGEAIPQARREAVPGARLCVACQSREDARETQASGGFNRRASKDSQLR
jgi:phage/conjugal plasmid C-4 type zinc finger TraR family protein